MFPHGTCLGQSKIELILEQDATRSGHFSGDLGFVKNSESGGKDWRLNIQEKGTERKI